MQRYPLDVSRFCSLLVGLVLFAMAGCSGNGLQPDYEKLGLVDVSGQVTWDGQPLGGIQVVFEESPYVYSYGHTDQNGRYQLMFDSRKTGIMPGKKTVRFQPISVSEAEEGLLVDNDPSSRSGPSPILPECYNRDSKIQVEVTQSTTAFDFSLKSDCSTLSSNP